MTAFASDFQSLTSQFAGADRATFSFTTEAQAAYKKTVFTRISSTAAAEPGISAPASVATGAGPFPNPGVAVSGEASAEAFSHTAFDYTFEIIGDRPETIAIRYGGKGDAPVGYEIELDDALGSALGADWIDWSGTGEEIWTIGSPGVYSLLIDGYSGVSVTGDPFGDASDYAAGWSLGVFDMRIAAVPELQTWAMMLIGLAALASAAVRRKARRCRRAPRGVSIGIRATGAPEKREPRGPKAFRVGGTAGQVNLRCRSPGSRGAIRSTGAGVATSGGRGGAAYRGRAASAPA